MNTFFAVAAAALAFVGSVAADTCSSAQQTSAYATLASLLTLSSFPGCTTDSGYSLLYSTALPTDAEYARMCASEDCQSLIEAVYALDPPDCDLAIPTSGAVMNVRELVTTFESECVALTATTAPPTDAPTTAPTDAPTTVPTTAPTDAPTTAPTDAPTDAPTTAPTDAPTTVPTTVPTTAPTDAPTTAPTDAPTTVPTTVPTTAPTDAPTTAPTDAPTTAPTDAPTETPSTTEPVAPGASC